MKWDTQAFRELGGTYHDVCGTFYYTDDKVTHSQQDARLIGVNKNGVWLWIHKEYQR